jgi:hypothetical protein
VDNKLEITSGLEETISTHCIPLTEVDEDLNDEVGDYDIPD